MRSGRQRRDEVERGVVSREGAEGRGCRVEVAPKSRPHVGGSPVSPAVGPW